MWKNKNTEIVYFRIMEADAGKAASKMIDSGSLMEHYSSHFINPNTQNPDHDDANYQGDYEEKNPHFIVGGLDDIDWNEILVSCHHMHGYRMDGTPLGINGIPSDFFV